MKNIFLSFLILTIIGLQSSPNFAHSRILKNYSKSINQDDGKHKVLEPGVYTSVGAFGVYSNAIKFHKFVKNKGYKTDWGYAPKKGLYYVYVLKTNDVQEAWRLSLELRQFDYFWDAWAMRYDYVPLDFAKFQSTGEKEEKEDLMLGGYHGTFRDIAAMMQEEPNIKDGQIVQVIDASAEASVNKGRAWFVRTATGWEKMNEEEAFKNGQTVAIFNKLIGMSNEGISVRPPRYPNLLARNTDEIHVIAGEIVEVIDASADPTISNGRAWYKRTKNGWEKISAEADFTENNGKDEEMDRLAGPSYHISFNPTASKSLKNVDTQIRMFALDSDRKLGEFQSHEVHKILASDLKSKKMKFHCDAFGYKTVDRFVDFENPVNDSTDAVYVRGDTIFVDYKLERYKVGDFIVLYNVYFYKDATIMKATSKKELEELLSMLKENDKLVVTVHGHTNGNAAGRIIKMSEEDTDYFRLLPTNTRTNGTAKKLSYERAGIIRDYLKDHGISEDRMTLKGWGGKRMIFDKYHADASQNVRVEIEIVKDS